MNDQELIKHLFAAIEERDAIIKTVIPELQKRIAELETKLAIYQNRKDSSNSHKPPSTDMNTPSEIRIFAKRVIKNRVDNRGMKAAHFSLVIKSIKRYSMHPMNVENAEEIFLK